MIFRHTLLTLCLLVPGVFSSLEASVRARPYPFGSERYVNLELYLRVRGIGLTFGAAVTP